MSVVTNDSRKRVPQGSIRLRGRLYPMPEAVRQRADARRPEPEEPPQSSFAEQLKNEISARLPLFHAPEPKTVAELSEVYVESLRVLEQFRQDIEDLIPPLCEANLQFRQGEGPTAEEVKQTVLATKLSEMKAKARLDIRRVKNAVTAELLAQPLPEVSASLHASLKVNVGRFAGDFFEALDQLVDRQIAGLVEWTGPNTCRYHFFREVVIQDQSSTETTSLGRERSESSQTGWVEHLKTTTTGTHTHRFARHEHHTVDAFQTRMEDSKVVMPLAVQQFVARIPDWLAPIVRVIDGKLAREIIIERDMKTEVWEEHDVRDVPVFGCEPAVVIDQIVLTGWGPRDIDAELARRAQETQDAKNRSAQTLARILAPASWMLGICLSALSLWLFAKATGSADLGLAVLPLLLTIPCWVTAVVSSARAEDRPLTTGQPALVALGLVTILGGIGLVTALGFASWAVPVITLALTATGIVLLLFSRPRRLP